MLPTFPALRPLAAAFLLGGAISLRATASEAPATTPPPASASSGPRLTFAEPSYSFGTVQQGEKVRHAFKVTNTGDAPLNLLDVRPACGCTTAGDWPRTLAPGQSGAIPLELDTTQFVGPLSKVVAVLSNDATQPRIMLELKGTVWTPISVATPVLIFPALSDPSQSGTRTTAVINHTENAVTVSAPESDNPHFEPRLEEIAPGKEWRLTVVTRPPLPDGTQAGRITLKTSHPKMPTVTVQTVVTVLPAIQVAPTEFAFVTSKLPAEEKRFAVLLNHRGADLQVSALETDAPGVKLATVVAPDRKQTTITLTFPAGFEIPKGTRYRLTGRTNQAAVPTFEIPIVYAGDR